MKRILKWSALSIFVLLFAFSLSVFYFAHSRYKADLISYMDLKLGSPMDEVLYAFGTPTNVVGDTVNLGQDTWVSQVYRVDGEDEINKIPEGKTLMDFAEWSYDRSGYRADINFSTDEKIVKEISCYTNSDQNCPRLFGVTTGMTEAKIVEVLGLPTLDSIKHGTKELSYDGLGLKIILSQRVSYMIVKHTASVDFDFMQTARVVSQYIEF